MQVDARRYPVELQVHVVAELFGILLELVRREDLYLHRKIFWVEFMLPGKLHQAFVSGDELLVDGRTVDPDRAAVGLDRDGLADVVVEYGPTDDPAHETAVRLAVERSRLALEIARLGTIFKLVADAWGCGDLFKDWRSPEATFQRLKELSRGQPCDFTGVRDYSHIEAAGGIQWPFTTADAQKSTSDDTQASRRETPGQRRLFADGRFFTPDGRARLHFDEPRPMPEIPDEAYPFLLLTGRGTSAQWHTGTRTNKSDVLRKLAPRDLYIELNPFDADRLRVSSGQAVVVRSRRGEARALALVTETVQPGQVFLPMHYETVNTLTFPAFDPHSRQPSYKACAVSVVKADV